jgi:hypothetical protein
MSNDPLALSVLTVGPLRETDYDAVYAAVTATDRGRWFLSEYAKHNRNADTDLIIAAIARVEAGLRGGAPSQSSAISAADLTAMAATIERIRVTVAAARLPMSNISGAAERISDISFGLRERSVDAALCDTLDAAAREITEACANSTAEDHAGGLTELLRDLAGRIDVLLKLSAAAQVSREVSDDAPSPALSEVPAEVLNQDLDETSAAMLRRPIVEPAIVVDTPNDSADAVMPLQAYRDDPEPPARALTVDGPRWRIESPDFVFAPTNRAADEVEAESVVESEPFHALLPATELRPELQNDPGPQDDPADLFDASLTREAFVSVPAPISPPAMSVPAPSESAVVLSLAKAAQQQLNGANSSATRAGPPPVTSDPLAAMHSLSDDEVIALFG